MKNADNGRKAILVVSFGTSYSESGENSIGAIETAVGNGFPEYEVRRAFTSQVIIDKLKRVDGEAIDNVKEAMARLVEDGVTDLIIQPTHVINGFEYDDMRDAARPFEAMFRSVCFGKPLLSDGCDYEELAAILKKAPGTHDRETCAVVFMGHGTEHSANGVYTRLAGYLKKAGYRNYYVGTVEASPSLKDVIGEVEKDVYEKVILLPLMIVAGDHAINDMAGDDEDSWKRMFEAKGYEVECVLKGLGEYPDIQDMFVRHAKEAWLGRKELFMEV